jgi:hypothetical protein
MKNKEGMHNPLLQIYLLYLSFAYKPFHASCMHASFFSMVGCYKIKEIDATRCVVSR